MINKQTAVRMYMYHALPGVCRQAKKSTLFLVCQNIHTLCVHFNTVGASVFLFAGLLRILRLE